MIKVFDSFAGYGGAEFALKKLGIKYETIGFSEIDKYAIQCWKQNHGEVKNFGDITKIKWKNVPDFDLLCGGFPCQDISIAGKQDLKKGRSILGFELARALREKQPKYFLFENVAAIEQEKFKDFLREMENEFKKAGYQVFRKKLNSKDFGIPQNRSRVWFIGFRNDLKKPFGWTPYPKEQPLKLKLKDVLEEKVDEKYFLSKTAMEKVLNHKTTFKERLLQKGDSSATLTARDYKEPKSIELTKNKPQGSRVYSSEGIACCQTDSMILKTQFGKHQQDCFYDANGIMANIPAGTHGSTPHLTKTKLLNGAIRRLTPKECFRLMGFLKDEIDLNGLSDTQCYKLAGNGWEINLVSKIFKRMFKEKKEVLGRLK